MKVVLATAALVMLSGCASIMTAEQQTINVTSSTGTPIEVTIDDKKVTTPGAVTVLRDGKDKIAATSAAGCVSATPVQKNIATPFWGNIVLGGLFGSTTDSATGKMWDYQDNVQVSCTNK